MLSCMCIDIITNKNKRLIVKSTYHIGQIRVIFNITKIKTYLGSLERMVAKLLEHCCKIFSPTPHKVYISDFLLLAIHIYDLRPDVERHNK